MLKIMLISLVFWMSGCTTLASKETFAVCELGDIATTVRAFHLSPLAYETSGIPVPILFTLKIALLVFVWQSGYWDDTPENKSTEPARIALNALACSPIPNNLAVAKGS